MLNRLRTLPRRLLAVLLLGTGWACSDMLVSVVRVGRVAIEPASVTLFEGEVELLQVRLEDQSGNRLVGRHVAWMSSAAEIAAVDSIGELRALAAGTATITATSEGVSDSAQVTVLRPPLLHVEPDTVLLSVAASEGAAAVTETVTISNAGDGTLAGLAVVVAYLDEDAGWLTASFFPDSSGVTLTADPNGLEDGVYSAAVWLSATNARNDPVDVLVRFQVIPDDREHPFPTLQVVQPSSGQRLATLDVTLEGSGFVEGVTTADFGPAIQVHGVSVVNATTLLTSIEIGAAASAGARDVSVANPEPGGGVATRPGAFTVLGQDAPPSPDASSVTAAPDTAVADGLDVVAVTVLLRDDDDNALGDLAGAFDIDVGSTVNVDSVVETSTRGTYMFNLQSTLAQTVALVVAVSGVTLAEQPTIEFVAGAAAGAMSAVTVSNPAPRADGADAALVTVTLRDQYENPITSLVDGNFVIDLSSLTAAASAVEHTADGVYTFEVTNTVAENVTVTVTADGVTLTQTPVIEFQAGAVNATQSSVSADPTTALVANGSDAFTVTVDVRDQHGNPINGLTVEDFDIDADGAAVSGFVANGGGEYQFQVTSTSAQAHDISVSVSGTPLNEVTVEFVPGPVDDVTTIVSVEPEQVVADGTETSTVTIPLRDANSNAIGGLLNDAFVVVPGGAAVASAVAEVGTTGDYTFTVTNQTAEDIIVSITVDGVELLSPVIRFVAGAVSAASAVVADSTTMTAGDTTDVTVTLVDAQTNAVSGQAGAFTFDFVEGGGSTGTVAEVGDSGIYTFTLTSTEAGTLRMNVTVGDVTLTQQVVIEITPAGVSAATSTVTAPPTADVSDGGQMAGGEDDD